MKILIIDKEAASLSFALRCMAAGHKVKMFVSPKDKSCRTGEGMVMRVGDWESHMSWADLVFMSDNSYNHDALSDYFRRGFPIFGCSPDASTWELDRERGQEILRHAGIKTIKGRTFDSYKEAISFVKEHPKRYVSKPNGDADKQLSYVAKNPADLLFMLQRWEEQGTLKDKFILQDFVPGIEMGVGGWFGPDGWSEYVCENWEFKKLMVGDVGVATGEMGTVLRYVRQSKLAEEVLLPLTHFLHAINYVGYCDVNCIITEKGVPLPLEFTMRPGWPLFNIQSFLHQGDPAEWMLDKVEGRDTLKVSPEVAVGVVLAIPDFPFCHAAAKAVEGVPIYGINPRNSKHLSLCQVMAGKAPVFEGGKIVERTLPVSAGTYLAVVSGSGPTVTEAKEEAYDILKEFEIPSSPMYRTDIGDRLDDQLPLLKAMGYAKGMRY